MGFEEILVNTMEGAGAVELCVVVFEPNSTLSFDFSVVVTTEDNTAGMAISHSLLH